MRGNHPVTTNLKDGTLPHTSARVAVTRRLPAETEALLQGEFGAALNASDRPYTESELAQRLDDADVLVCTVTDMLGSSLLRPDRRTRLLANFGVGVDHIDLAAAAAAGIAVTNTPGVLTEATAELAITLMLMAGRRAAEGERLARSGAWSGWAPTQLLGQQLAGLSLGVVGMGRIGTATARMAALGLGMPVRYWSRSAAAPDGFAATREPTLEALLANSDVVTLHVPATDQTSGLIGASELATMRSGAILVNTSRGSVVDADALADALRRGHLFAAGLDVYEDEPRIPESLRALPNVTLLPHLGSATERTRRAMGDRVVANVRAFRDGQPLPDRVTPSGW